MSDNRVYLYDCTLRDGAQTQGVDFNASDKELIAEELDRLGIDYIEGGWPGANPTDDAFFKAPPKLSRARLTAFGMTRRAGRSTDNDPGLKALIDGGTSAICMVGKTWDFHVDVALEIEHDENVAMIADSIAHAVKKVDEVLFDAEHFFDGYKENPQFALRCLQAAADAGARWIVLCDTNGGTLPHEITDIVTEVRAHIPGHKLGIHCHDDTGNAVANSLAAVRAGARQIQGALNGLGERCGNANLITIIPSLMLKMGYETGISKEDLSQLTHLSRVLDEHLNRGSDSSAPPMSGIRRSPTRAACTYPPSRRTPARTSISTPPSSVINAILSSPIRPGARTFSPVSAKLAWMSMATATRSPTWSTWSSNGNSAATPMTAPRPVSSCWPVGPWARCRTISRAPASGSSTSAAGTPRVI